MSLQPPPSTIIAKRLFDLDENAAVYEVGTTPTSLFYWKFNNSFRSHGPFHNAVACSKDYETKMAQIDAVAKEQNKNVFFVDFVNKRRLA